MDYNQYTDYVYSICKTRDLSSFKTNPNYTWVLEHVNKKQGNEYIYYIKNKTNITENEIKEFCTLNDSIGNPNKEDFGFVTCSPTSLRYIFHAHLILTHMSSLNLSSIDIVEIGGGYGGLCLAIHHFSKKYNSSINSYSIVDLHTISNLQKLYLSQLIQSLNINYIDASTFGSSILSQNMFLVSNYCFSEISKEYQAKYIEVLFPKVSHGFMVWNMIPTYDFGFKFIEENEYPNTGEFNKYIKF